MAPTRTNNGFSLPELLAVVAITAIVLAAVGVWMLRGTHDAQALGWVEGARQMIGSVREGYRVRDDYADLSYTSAVTNGWVPLALQAPTGNVGKVPWNGSWRITAGQRSEPPLKLPVTFGVNDKQGVAACIAVTLGLRDVASHVQWAGGTQWQDMRQLTQAAIANTCAGAGGQYVVYGFAY